MPNDEVPVDKTVQTDADFDFNIWTATNKLSRKTCIQLRKDEFTNLESLLCLTDADMGCMGLPYGQFKLLIKAVKSLRPSDDDGSNTSPTRQDPPQEPQPSPEVDITIEDIRKQAKELDMSGKYQDNLPDTLASVHGVDIPISSNAAHPTTAAQKLSPHDPRSILTLRSTSKKAMNFSQFLTETAKLRLKKKTQDFVLTESNTGNGETPSMVIQQTSLNIRTWASVLMSGELPIVV